MPYIDKVEANGLVMIEFTRPILKIDDRIDLSTLEYEAEPDVWLPSLTIEIEPYKLHDPDDLKMTWSVVSVSQNSIDV